MSLKLYRVKDDGAEWGIPVVANTAREAKALGFPVIKELVEQEGESADYVLITVRRIKEIAVPASVSKPQAFETCCEIMPWGAGAFSCEELSPDDCEFFKICHKPCDMPWEGNPEDMTWEEYDAMMESDEEVSDGR